MDRKEFLGELRFLLSDFPKKEVDEIVYDYEEHFDAAGESGKTEEEIVRDLGDARLIAKQYRASLKIEKAQKEKTVGNIFSAVFSTLALGFFNIIIILGPFFGVIGVIVGLFGAAIGIAFSGLGLMIASFWVSYFPTGISFAVGFPILMLIGLGMACLGILFFIADFYISKAFYLITVKYLRWNINLVKGSKGGVNQ